MEAKVLQFKHCCGCGSPAKDRAVFVALPGLQYICEGCIEIAVAIVANEAPHDARIEFVDNVAAIMKEPTEIVAKWKEIKIKKELEAEYAARD